MKTMRSISVAALCALAVLVAFPASAQSAVQKISLGEAARRLREQQKPPQKPAKVWTNDDIPRLSVFGVNVVGPIPESLTKPAEEGQEAAPGSAEDTEKQRKEVEAALAEEKARLDTATKELDLLQRQLTLDQQQFYSNPSYQADTAGQARLDASRAQIAAKQQEVQQAKDKVAELEAKLAKLKAPAPANPAPTPQPQP
jgi:hypothetical protein